MTAAVSNPASSTEELAKHRKLAAAASQFEAIFLNQMLSSAHFFESPDAGEDGGGSSGDASTFASIGTQAMANAISAAGGFGIAHRIVAGVEAEHTHQTNRDSEKKLQAGSSPIAIGR